MSSCGRRGEVRTRRILEIWLGRTPSVASSIIFFLLDSGRGLPLRNIPPSWLTLPPPCYVRIRFTFSLECMFPPKRVKLHHCDRWIRRQFWRAHMKRVLKLTCSHPISVCSAHLYSLPGLLKQVHLSFQNGAFRRKICWRGSARLRSMKVRCWPPCSQTL